MVVLHRIMAQNPEQDEGFESDNEADMPEMVEMFDPNDAEEVLDLGENDGQPEGMFHFIVLIVIVSNALVTS